MIVVVGVAPTVSVAVAQDPRPEELWEAYPLDPGERADPSDPAPTPTTAPERRAGSPARSAAPEDDGGAPLVPALIGGVVAAFAAGLGAAGVARRRRRRRATAAPQVAEPARAVPAPTPARPAPEAVADDRAEFLPPAGQPPAPSSAWRFARMRPWPKEAERAWTCEIEWKPGYIKSGFRAMAAPPGEPRRRPFAQSRAIKWTLMGDPEPPTEDMVEVVQELVTALTEDGWVRIGPAGPWYSQRFLWGGEGQPRPLAPLTGKEANA